MKEILELIIKNLVEKQDEVSITENTNAKSVCYEVRVAEDEMGKVIGKQGKMAKSIRNVMKALAVKEHKRVSIDFVEK